MKTRILEQVKREFYTNGEAAAVLGVARQTIWRWINEGKLEGHHLGREVLIEKAAIEKLKTGVVS